MLNRRKVLFGAAALMAAALPAMPVMASDSRLLADILAGVSDALTRDYIRRHYQEGRWDGSHWNYGGRRYTAAEYGRYWSKHYEERREPKKPSGPAPAAFRRSRPQAAACRRSGAPSPARRRSASASLRRSGRQRPGRSRRSPLTPLRLNRSRTSHRDAGPSPIHGLPTVSIQVPVFGLTNVRWRTIILAMEG